MASSGARGQACGEIVYRVGDGDVSGQTREGRRFVQQNSGCFWEEKWLMGAGVARGQACGGIIYRDLGGSVSGQTQQRRRAV